MPNYPIPSCPVTIEPPNANGFSLQAKKSKDGIITEMGSKRTRRFNTSNVYVISAEFSFDTIDKFLYFLRWLKYETNYGNLWFKADWFSDIGFDAGEWVFRFVDLPFSNTGYSQKHQATLLMGPYNDNVVSGDYTEVGIGGTFIDDDFPFGYDLFQVEQIIQNRIYFGHPAFALSYNGTNVTVLNADTNVGNFAVTSGYTIIGACQLSRTRFVYLMTKYTFSSPNYIQSFVLRTIDFIDGVWTNFGENEVFTKSSLGPAEDAYNICALSETEVAIISSFTDPWVNTDIFLRKLVYSGTWATSGAELTISLPSSSYLRPSITALSSSRVAITLGGSNLTKVILRVYDFSGSWSQFGSDFDTDITISDVVGEGIAYARILARSETEVTINGAITPDEFTIEYKQFDYTFNGTEFEYEAESFGAIPNSVMVAKDVMIYISTATYIRAVKRTAGVWAFDGLETNIDSYGSFTGPVCVGLPHFMWNS